MILLTKMNGEPFSLNCNLIESISEQPDTRISLTNGNMYMVRESMDEVIRRTIDYHRQTLSDLLNGRFEKGGLENGR